MFDGKDERLHLRAQAVAKQSEAEVVEQAQVEDVAHEVGGTDICS